MGVFIVAGSGPKLDFGVILSLTGLACYALYTGILREGRRTESAWGSHATDGRKPLGPVDPLVLATATASWGTAIMLPSLGFESGTGTFSLPAGGGGLGGLFFLGVVITAPTLVLFNYGAERLPTAITGIVTAAIPALGFFSPYCSASSPM